MSNITPGDIVISRTGNTWISKTIAWLTKSDVTHAALVLEDGRIAEMGPGGLSVNKIEIHEGNDEMLLRLLPEKYPAPLMKAAQMYIDSEVRYDFPALAFLGGLIVYRNIRPTNKINTAIDLVLRSATVVLTKMIQKIILKNPGEAYWGWYFGTHNGQQTYTTGPMIGAMRQHKAIIALKQSICESVKACCKEKSNDCCNQKDELDNLSGSDGHRVDLGNNFDEFLSFPLIVLNPWSSDADMLSAAIGSFVYAWQVTSIDCTSPITPTVDFRVSNTAGVASATAHILHKQVVKIVEVLKPSLQQTFTWSEPFSC